MSKEMNKKTSLTKLEKENLGNVNGGYTIEVFNDGTVEVCGIIRPGHEASALRRIGNIPPLNASIAVRFNNLFQAALWASRHLLPHNPPPPTPPIRPIPINPNNPN